MGAKFNSIFIRLSEVVIIPWPGTEGAAGAAVPPADGAGFQGSWEEQQAAEGRKVTNAVLKRPPKNASWEVQAAWEAQQAEQGKRLRFFLAPS